MQQAHGAVQAMHRCSACTRSLPTVVVVLRATAWRGLEAAVAAAAHRSHGCSSGDSYGGYSSCGCAWAWPKRLLLLQLSACARACAVCCMLISCGARQRAPTHPPTRGRQMSPRIFAVAAACRHRVRGLSHHPRHCGLLHLMLLLLLLLDRSHSCLACCPALLQLMQLCCSLRRVTQPPHDAPAAPHAWPLLVVAVRADGSL